VRKVIRPQTSNRIEKLTAEGRTPVDPATGVSSSELNGFELLCDLSRDRIGVTPGLSDEEAAAEAKDQDIWECYAEETRWPGTLKEMRKHLEKTPGVFIFRHWHRHSSQYEMNFVYESQQPKRVQERVPVRPPLAKPYEPIPIEPESTAAPFASNAQKPAPVVEIRVKSPATAQPELPELPKRRRKCRRYFPGDDGECACPACHEYAMQMAEWFKQRWGTPAA
jgi:hypothetical protein